jgi:hypothetical protein
LRTSALVSKKKKSVTTQPQAGPASASAIFSKRREVMGSQVLKSSFIPLLSQATQVEPMGPPGPPPVLRSAFRIPPTPATGTLDSEPQWSRSCTTVKSTFIRTKAYYSFADGLRVTFNTTSGVQEVIEIAKKFMSAKDEGYIGEGFTKRGIYVCQFHFVIQVSI